MLLTTLTRATLNFRKYFIGLQKNMLLQKRKLWEVTKPFSATKCLEEKYTEEAYYEIFTEKPLLWKTSVFTKKNKGINVCFCEKNVLKNTFKKLQKMVLSWKNIWNFAKPFFYKTRVALHKMTLSLSQSVKSILRGMPLVGLSITL